MDIENAKYLLSFHSSRNEDIENLLWDSGFVRLLRPFKDKIFFKCSISWSNDNHFEFAWIFNKRKSW